MKKIASIVVVVAIVFASFSLPQYAFADNDELTNEEYSSQLIDMIHAYNYSGGLEDNDVIGTAREPLNRLIVKTNSNSPLENDCGAVAKIEGYNNLHIMQYVDSETAETAYAYFENLSDVLYVEYDFLMSDLEPETEYEEYEYNKNYLSWGTEATNADKTVSYVNYYKKDAPEIIVAVLDSGIDFEHEFLKGRIEGSAVDLVEEDYYPADDQGHGTRVAGVIADNTAENVKVEAYKVADSSGNVDYLVACYAIDLAVINGADVINMSFSENKDTHPNMYNTYEKSIQYAIENNVVVVAAAGNQYSSADVRCPACNKNVITVAASNKNNEPADFSNRGSCVDIAAPGVEINSCTLGGGYMTKDGTSYSAPLVSAAAAFLKTFDKNFKPSAIEYIIKNYAYVPDGWDTDYGTGIIDFSAILSNVVSDFPKISINESKKAEITYPTKNVTIYYTTDGSEPIVGTSNVYSEPFDISGAVCVKAIASERGKFPSACATLKINWKENITMRYKGTKNMLLPPGRKIDSCFSHNEEIVTVDKKNQTIYGVAPGKTKVTVFLETGQTVTYNVTVEYESWQWFIIYFFGGWIWYVPEPFFPFIKT